MTDMKPIILIVDDDPAGRESIRSILMNQPLELNFAASGEEALNMARRILPDIILLDVMMPEMDGFEVCRHLRADPNLAEVPVVMVTTLDDRESRLESIQAGADDFISKPIDRAELRARVNTITRLNRYRQIKIERSNLERQVQRLTALRTVGLAISGCLDLDIILAILLQQINDQLAADACDIILIDHEDRTFSLSASRGFWKENHHRANIILDESEIGRSLLARQVVNVSPLTRDVSTALRFDAESEHFKFYCGIPLVVQNRVLGVLEVYQRYPLEPDSTWMEFLQAICEQAAIAIFNARLYGDLQQSNIKMKLAYDETIEGWSKVLEIRDRETEGHSLRVTHMTLRLAEAIGISPEELVHIRRGALLHDIGKLSIPDNILFKPGPLTPEEWVVMRRHPVYAYDLLSRVEYLKPAIEIPYYHHEKWDGSGYPKGLQGKGIPLAARVFAIVDVWDALRSDRPYRAAWTNEHIIEHLRAETGTHFDPDLVEVFLQVLSKQEVDQ